MVEGRNKLRGSLVMNVDGKELAIGGGGGSSDPSCHIHGGSGGAGSGGFSGGGGTGGSPGSGYLIVPGVGGDYPQKIIVKWPSDEKQDAPEDIHKELKKYHP